MPPSFGPSFRQSRPHSFPTDHALLGGVKGDADPWASLDGRASAPSGTPQFASLLNAYPTASSPDARVRWPTLTGTQPQWMVAGVDYAVGIDRSLYPTNSDLKDPAPGGTLATALSAIGGTLTTNRITFNGPNANNCVIDGYNFTLHGGLSVQFQNCSNPTVQNGLFEVGADTEDGAIRFLSSVTGGATAQKNEINGNNTGAIGFGLITSNAAGQTLILYNYLYNAPAEAIVLGSAPSAATHITQYNLIRNTLGNRTNYHGDWVQEVTSPGQTVQSTSYLFNTFIVDETGTSTQGLSIFDANETMGECVSVTIGNNCFVSASASYGQPNYSILLNETQVSGTASIQNNFADITGNNLGFRHSGQDGTTGPYTPTVAVAGNINLTDGSSLDSGGGAGTDVAFVVGSTAQSSLAATKSLSFALQFTTVGGADHALVMSMHFGGDPGALGTFTYGGETLTQFGTTIVNAEAVALFYLVNPPAGDNTLTGSWTNAVEIGWAGAEFSGVDSSAPLANFASATGTDATPTLAVTTASGDAAYACNTNGGANWSSNTQTKLVADQMSDGAHGMEVSYGLASGNSVAFSWSNFNSVSYAAAGAAINHA